MFVLNHTNEKTRKLLLSMIDKMGTASAVVSSRGEITFFNEQFDKLVRERLHAQKIPASIYDLVSCDPPSLKTLRELIAQIQ